MAYNADEPSFHILISLIEIWKPGSKTIQELIVPQGKADMMIAEVGSLEIKESYQNIVNTAKIVFPRGTVIKNTVDCTNEEEAANAVTSSVSTQGILIESRTNTDVLTNNHFEVGSRIRIWLGYTQDPAIYQLTKLSTGKPNIWNSDDAYADYMDYLTPMFEGFITKVGVDTPIELDCENMGYLLKQVTCKPVNTSVSATVQDILNGKNDTQPGTHALLAKTGLKLIKDNPKITIGKMKIVDDYTVADVVRSWQKWGIFAYIAEGDNGELCLAVRRTFSSETGEGSLVDKAKVLKTPIDFAYNVANNGLTLINTNKNYIAIKAQCRDKENKNTTSLTIVTNPQWKEGDPEKERWRTVKETKISKRAQKKHHLRMVSEGSGLGKLDDNYQVIEYISKNQGLTHDQLLDEAIEFYKHYNVNGIDGSLTLFGDFALHTTDVVQLQDNRYSAKNGIYFIDEVTTSFGTGGYRQTIKLPYCIQRYGENSNSSNS